MQVDIKATGMELTEAIRSHVQKKMDALDAKTAKFGDVVRAEVEVEKKSRHHRKGPVFRAEVHVRLPGKTVYAQADHYDLYAAIGQAHDEADRQITDYKGSLRDKSRGRA